MNGPSFFNFDLKQPVNQWLGIALVSVMCFWVVVYYLANRTVIIGDNFVQASTLRDSN
jgi:hypothetical protein